MDLKISALEYTRGVRDGTISAEEFVAATMERIRSTDGRLHAFLSVSEDAQEQARGIDRRVRAGQDVGSCPGLAVSVKDNICVRNTRTTCASRMLQDYVSPYDATVISRLREQGAVLVGKTNMDEFAMGLTTEFSAFGPSRNPWNEEYVPGGSSGGSAVSVRTYQCSASLGSDTGGSVRNPASFCGVVGFKPTYGLVSRYGLVSYANSVEQIGPLARTVEDCALVLNVISGRDEHDDTTVRGSVDDFLSGIGAGIEGMRIGIVREMTGEGVDGTVLSVTRQAVAKLEGLGASCEEVSMDMIEYSVPAYYAITSTEAGSNLARYDNLRYGYDLPLEGYEFNAYITKAREMFGPEVKRRIILGGFIPSAKYVGKYLSKALRAKAELIREMTEIFSRCDLLVAPTVPVMPFRLGEMIDDPVALFQVDAHTVAANLAGVPAVSMPVAVRNGLPVGLQMMGRPMGDADVLRAAYALQGEINLPEVPA